MLAGGLRATIGDDEVDLAVGDSVTIPAAVTRQLTAVDDARMMVCGHSGAVATVPGEDFPRGTPPWIA